MTQTIYVKFSYENKVSEEVPIHTQLDLSKNAGINRRRLLNLLLNSVPDAPVCAFIFTNDDVFVMNEDGNPDPVQREIAETVLLNLDSYDHIYTEIFNVIEQELAEIQ